MSKPITQMSFAELSEEMAAARAAVRAAEYQDGLAAWQAAKDSAEARLRAVNAEIDARLSRMAVEEKEEKTDGG